MQKKWKVAGGVAAGLIVIGAITSNGDGNDQTTPTADSNKTVTAPATPKATTTPQAKPPAKTTTPKAPKAKPAPKRVAASVEKAVLNGLVAKTFTDTCGPIAWSCAITEMKDGATGNVDVYVQERLTKAEAKKIAMNVANFAKCDVPDLDWVIVHEAGGGARGQVRASDSLINC